MSRHFLGALAAGAFAVVVGACGEDAQSSAGGGAAFDLCGSYASCAACTPVGGCGWCFSSGPHGACSSDPDTCAQGPTRWTWNPSGCLELAHPSVVEEAGPVVMEAGPDASTAPR